MTDELDFDELDKKKPEIIIKRFILEVKTYPNGDVFTSTRPMKAEAKYFRAAAKRNKKEEVQVGLDIAQDEEGF